MASSGIWTTTLCTDPGIDTDTRTQFVRDAVDYLQITPLYTPTDDQPADGLTKAVGADVIRRHLPYYTGTCACPDMHNIYT